MKELLEVGEDPSSSVANDEVQVSDMAEAASTLRMSYVSYCSDPIPAITQVRARLRSTKAVPTSGAKGCCKSADLGSQHVKYAPPVFPPAFFQVAAGGPPAPK